MKVFDLNAMTAHSYEQRDKNVFYRAPEFKTRIIELPPNGHLPVCEMADHVLFYVVEGEADITVDAEMASLKSGQCLVTPPATVSMTTRAGARLLGVQIVKAPGAAHEPD